MNIGMQISELRKSRNLTQENLASAVGVTAQAVSKWESGGTPDVELLPVIADYFGVSLDSLFGRSSRVYGNLDAIIGKAIADCPRNQKFAKAFDFCWAIEKGLAGDTDNQTTVDEISTKHRRIFSRVLCDYGVTTLAFARSLRYFLMMPSPPAGWEQELAYKDEYANFLTFLGNRNALKLMYALCSRDNKPFTPRLIEKLLGVGADEADCLLQSLIAYGFVTESTIELDDELKAVYNFQPNPAFIGLLAMCDELLHAPNGFYCYVERRDRPYLSQS